MDSLIYQDNTHKDIWLKLVLAIPLVIILAPAFSSLASGDTRTAYEMFAIVVVIAVVIWLIIPRRYLIFNSKVKIVLGGLFSFTIPFHTIKTARSHRWTTLGINLPSSLSTKHVVEIVRNNRMPIIITPANRDLFLETLEKALSDWRTYHNRGS